ncbi:hypothetical protein PCE1_001599 [Barthelona sp. PCE]
MQNWAYDTDKASKFEGQDLLNLDLAEICNDTEFPKHILEIPSDIVMQVMEFPQDFGIPTNERGKSAKPRVNGTYVLKLTTGTSTHNGLLFVCNSFKRLQPGCKILLKRGTPIANGFFLMKEPENFEVLGGRVETLCMAYDMKIQKKKIWYSDRKDDERPVFQSVLQQLGRTKKSTGVLTGKLKSKNKNNRDTSKNKNETQNHDETSKRRKGKNKNKRKNNDPKMEIEPQNEDQKVEKAKNKRNSGNKRRNNNNKRKNNNQQQISEQNEQTQQQNRPNKKPNKSKNGKGNKKNQNRPKQDPKSEQSEQNVKSNANKNRRNRRRNNKKSKSETH